MVRKFATLLGSAVAIAALAHLSPVSAAGVDELSSQIQNELYNTDMLDPMQPIGLSAYRDWKTIVTKHD
jgi:ribose transport system substrate-binding protein